MKKRLIPEEACRLVGEELGIERSCVRSCFDESDSRVCCLVGSSFDMISRGMGNNILRFLFRKKKIHYALCVVWRMTLLA